MDAREKTHRVATIEPSMVQARYIGSSATFYWQFDVCEFTMRSGCPRPVLQAWYSGIDLLMMSYSHAMRSTNHILNVTASSQPPQGKPELNRNAANGRSRNGNPGHGVQYVRHSMMLAWNWYAFPVHEHSLAQNTSRAPRSVVLIWPEYAGIEPCPHGEQANGGQCSPTDPDPAPYRQKPEREHGDARPATPRICVTHPDFV